MAGRGRAKEWAALPASLSIGVGQNREATDADGVTIDIVDETSNLLIARVDMSYLALCDGFRGRGNVPCTVRRNDNPNIGKRHENKTEEVTIPAKITDRTHGLSDDPRAEKARQRVYAYLQECGWVVDGWEPTCDDVFNFHNRVRDKQNTWRVSFHRYVSVEGGEA